MIRVLLLIMLAAAPAQTADTDIRKVLSDQVTAWNRGDVEGFMKGYEASPQTTYAGASGITKGYDQVLKRYRQRYGTKEKMGKLAFSDIEIRTLDDRNAVVTGRFQLERTAEAGGKASGWFTLIFVKRDTAWKIIHDHTS